MTMIMIMVMMMITATTTAAKVAETTISTTKTTRTLIKMMVMMMTTTVTTTTKSITTKTIVFMVFKGSIRGGGGGGEGGLYSLLAQTTSDTCIQAVKAQSGASHVQYTEHFSRATCRVQWYSSTIKCKRAEIEFMLALFYWLKSLTADGGEKTGLARENLGDELQKRLHTKARTLSVVADAALGS